MSKVRSIAEEKKTSTKKKAVASRSAAPKKKKVAAKKKTVTKKAAPKKTTARKPSAPKKEAPKKIRKAKPVLVDVIADKETEAVFSAPSYRPDYQLNIDNESETVYPENDFYEEEEGSDFDFGLSDNNDDYDKQRKFFSEFTKDATESHEADVTAVTAAAPRKTSIKLYRRQAAVYLGATLVLILAVLYFFFIKLTVYIYPQGEVVNDNTTFTVTSATETESPFPIVRGEAKLSELSAEKVYRTNDQPQENNENCRVVGTVTLYNKMQRNQPLVATTRLLAEDGRLYRLERGVTVPAGGQITASVYADQIGKSQLLTDPIKLTVPGLAASLSDIVYAENTQAFSCQDVNATRRVITQSDLDKAKTDIEEVLDQKAKNDFRPAAGQAVTYDEVPGSFRVEFNVKVGDQREEFIATAKKSYTLARFAHDDVVVLAKNRLAMLMSDDKQLTGFDAQSLAYTLESYNLSPSEATVKVYFSGVMSLKENTVLVDRKKLVGLNEAQISEYLHQFPEVRDYRLEFWPPFIKNAPQLPDKITVKVVE